MIDKPKQYFAVHVDSSNSLRGIHYVPIPDSEIGPLKQEFDHLKQQGEWMSSGPVLRNFMSRYLMSKFDYDILSDPRGHVYMFDFDPVSIDSLPHTPENPRSVAVDITVGEDESVEFNIIDAQEELFRDSANDYSVITLTENPDPCIRLTRFSELLPHLTNTVNITSLGMPGWNVSGRIESIEQDDNVTTYHCRNSLFPFKIVVTAHIYFWYDPTTPIYKD